MWLVLWMQVVNSVVMNHVSIGDCCSIQGSVICSNVQLQERAVVKDCQVICFAFFSDHFFMIAIWIGMRHCWSWQVGAGYVVTAGSECKGEVLAKKWNWDVRIQAGKLIPKWLMFCFVTAWSKFCAFCWQQLQFGVGRRGKEILILPTCMRVLCSLFRLLFVWKWLQLVLNIHLC